MELRAREEQPDGREEAGERRHDRGADAELGRERGGVDRAGAAVGDEDEVGRIAPALGGDGTQRPHHRGVREPVDAAGRLVGCEAERRRRRVATASAARSAETVRSPDASGPVGM